MQPISPDAVLDALAWRYATKKFDAARKIDPTTWAALEKAAMLAPSSFGLQPWTFVVVTDPTVRAKLRSAAYDQPQITDCSHLLVFCRRLDVGPKDVERYLDRIVEVRGVARESLSGFRDSMLGTIKSKGPEQSDVWVSRQVYISLGIFLATAAMLGVDACPMEGFEPAKFDEILGLKAQGYASQVLAAAGYRGDDPMAKQAKVRWTGESAIRRV